MSAMPGAPRGHRSGSIPTLTEPRYTARTPAPRIRMGSGDAPDVIRGSRGMMVVPRATNATRSMRHTVVIDRETGFVDTVRAGIDSRGNVVVSNPTTSPNPDDMRHPDARDARGYVATYATTPTHNPDGTYRPARRETVNGATGKRVIVDDNVNGGMVSPRRIRTVADGDAPLAGIRSADMVRDGARPDRPRKPRTAPARKPRAEKSDPYADVRAFAVAHGIPLEKIADKRVRAAIRDLIAEREATARYIAR